MSPKKSKKIKKIATVNVLEIGNFEDLEHLVGLLNQRFQGTEYRLEAVPHQEKLYLFIEDPLEEDSYECGLVEKKGAKAYAYSNGVYQMILGAYQRYLDQVNMP